MTTSLRGAPLRVVIAGGGVAALETLLALRVLAGARTAITVIAPERDFTLRPATVGEPFELAEARQLSLSDIAADQDAELVMSDLASVDVARHVAETRDGHRVPFDVLVAATGAVPTEPLAGALAVHGRPDVSSFRGVLDDLVSGAARSVAFVLPAERVWPLPLYELALMTAAHLTAEGVRDRWLTIVTPEAGPLAVFGPSAAEALGPLLDERGIELRTLARVESVGPDAIRLVDGRQIDADRVVTLPILEGPAIPGLPSDGHGFLPVDLHGRVRSQPDIYAAGDVTAFPLKQGGLAAQQADAVAEAIAARAGAPVTPRPFRPVVRGLLLTGGVPIYLRAEPGSPGVAERAGASTHSTQALWWPPGKVAGRFLAPYLSSARPAPLGARPLVDRVAVGHPDETAGHNEALDLTLLLAEADARWGDVTSALRALEAAEALEGALPPEWEHRRAAWSKDVA
jgi:sulfide:quinone oxidoreductase